MTGAHGVINPRPLACLAGSRSTRNDEQRCATEVTPVLVADIQRDEVDHAKAVSELRYCLVQGSEAGASTASQLGQEQVTVWKDEVIERLLHLFTSSALLPSDL